MSDCREFSDAACSAEFLKLKTVLGESVCAKKHIAAGTYLKGGVFVYATNHCDHEGSECPRLNVPSGQGYHLCNAHHAEANLAKMIEDKELGSDVVWLVGHYWACEPCASALKSVGIKEIRIRENP